MASENNRIEKAGQLLAGAWTSSIQVEAFADDLFPRTIAQATRIQDAMAARIDDEVVGWKVAGRPGPLLGRVFASHLYKTPAQLAAKRYPDLLLECEIGFRMERDLPPRPEPYSEDEVLDGAMAMCSLELVGTRFVNGKCIAENERDLLQICADNAAHAALVAGPEIPDWREVDLTSIAVAARIDEGDLLARNANPIERPEVTLVWLANTLSDRGIGLAAGQYVTTGSLTLPAALRRAKRVAAAFEGYGEISMVISPG